MKKSLLQQKYVARKKQALVANIAPPTEAEIRGLLRIQQVGLHLPGHGPLQAHLHRHPHPRPQADKDKAKERADKISRELQGGAAFEDLVVKYSEDKTSRYTGGDFGYIRRDDAARKQLLGKDFFDAPFRMKAGAVERSAAARTSATTSSRSWTSSRSGCSTWTTRSRRRTPTRSATKCGRSSLQRRQADVYQKALLDLVAELKKKAEVKIFDQNLTW